MQPGIINVYTSWNKGGFRAPDKREKTLKGSNVLNSLEYFDNVWYADKYWQQLTNDIVKKDIFINNRLFEAYPPLPIQLWKLL